MERSMHQLQAPYFGCLITLFHFKWRGPLRAPPRIQEVGSQSYIAIVDLFRTWNCSLTEATHRGDGRAPSAEELHSRHSTHVIQWERKTKKLNDVDTFMNLFNVESNLFDSWHPTIVFTFNTNRTRPSNETFFSHLSSKPLPILPGHPTALPTSSPPGPPVLEESLKGRDPRTHPNPLHLCNPYSTLSSHGVRRNFGWPYNFCPNWLTDLLRHISITLVTLLNLGKILNFVGKLYHEKKNHVLRRSLGTRAPR